MLIHPVHAGVGSVAVFLVRSQAAKFSAEKCVIPGRNGIDVSATGCVEVGWIVLRCTAIDPVCRELQLGRADLQTPPIMLFPLHSDMRVMFGCFVPFKNPSSMTF